MFYRFPFFCIKDAIETLAFSLTLTTEDES